MNEIQVAYINALLADASYVTEIAVGEATSNGFGDRLTTTQAAYLAANFEVVSSIESPKMLGSKNEASS
ncbi:hypothetical protein AAHN93_07165 [Vandammella animalimorsus]|uniref:hypothetical protein n=1 Tax=Vandammella animalimorsus TaxID=2029117 RepID=UPI00155173F5|nr:hypothetical protein [Vandammella animalimorsus]